MAVNAEYEPHVGWVIDGGPFNPIDDNGDALRLAVKARLTVCTDGDSSVSAHTAYDPDICFVTQFIKYGEDKQAAVRRAITRAAAKIQLNKEQANG